MTVYRSVREYRNGRLWLLPGRVVDLADDIAADIERDAPGVLVRADAAPAGVDEQAGVRS